MKRNIKILDCTLRDGGLGLDDAILNGTSNLVFEKNDMCEVAINLCKSSIDIIELGAIEISEDDKRNVAIYQDIESISKEIPKERNPDQIYAALYRGPDTPIEDIPQWNPSYCDALRVIIRYSELQKSIDFCKELAKKNYKVFVQPMVTMRYTDDEIQLLIDSSNEMGAYALYFVDTYGYMFEKDVTDLFTRYDKGLHSSIKIGFHAHNNMNLAFSNALAFLDIKSERDIVIDSTCLGMGQGAGNLQTEIIIDHMNKYYGTSYNYDAVLDACEIIEKYLNLGLWGYSLTRLLPAIHNTAYKYSSAFRERYELSYLEVNRILKNIPEDYRHRYTPENAIELLEMFGLKDRIT
jgi:4-hydroxy 2-oxovalerate aldolase